jgi:hypothetical protein
MLSTMNIDPLTQEPVLVFLLILLAIWSFIWKGFALYRAGSNRSVPWFVVLFILNTAGILDILYLFVFGKKKVQ